MRKVCVFIAVVLLWSVGAAHAATIQLGSLTGNDFIDWKQMSSSYTEAAPIIGTSVIVTTNLGRFVTAANPDGTAWFREGSLWLGDFAPGEYLLSADAQSEVLTFTTPVAALGAQIQATAFGIFAAQLQLFDSLNNLLGTFSVLGSNDGSEDDSNPFLGAASDSANIAKAIFSITFNNQDFGLGLGRVELSDTSRVVVTPEPATLTLMAIGAVGIIRRRFSRAA